MADKIPLKAGATGAEQFVSGDTIPASMIGIVPKFETPTGSVNGSNTVFTLSSTPVANASVIMVLDGVTSTNGTDYTVSGTTVTFTTAPASGTEIVAIYNNAASAGGGDFSSNTSSSVDGEVVLFSGNGGKTGKRATGTGLAKLTSGVISALTAAQATTELNSFVGDSGSGGTKGLVPAPASGDAAANKFLKADGNWSVPNSDSIITPSQITSDQDNYSPTGWAAATVVRLSGDSGFRAITSFSATSISDGHEKTLINVGSYPIYFPGEHPDGTAANRFDLDEDFILYPKAICRIQYDSTSSRWRVFAIKNAIGRMMFYQMSAGSTTAGDNALLAFLSIGTGTNTAQAAAAGAPAAFQISTFTASTNGAAIFFPKSANTLSYFSDAHIWADFFFNIPTLSDGTNTFTACVQITNIGSSTSESPNNTIGVRYGSAVNSGKFLGYSKDNSGTESTVDLGTTVVAGTLYRIRIEIDKARTEVRFYLNGSMVGRITANLPSAVVCATRAIILKSAGTSARSINVHNIATAAIYP